jgi:hypothetical protein
MIDFHPLAFHLEQTEALKGHMRKLNRWAKALAPHIQCTCDFTEQNQHIGCPAYTLQQMLDLTGRYLTKQKTESL